VQIARRWGGGQKPSAYLHVLNVHGMKADQTVVVHHLTQRAAHAVKFLLQLASPSGLSGRFAFFPVGLVTSHLLVLTRAGLGGGDLGNIRIQIPANTSTTYTYI
jgi:hypothetical protein